MNVFFIGMPKVEENANGPRNWMKTPFIIRVKVKKSCYNQKKFRIFSNKSGGCGKIDPSRKNNEIECL